VSFLFFLTVILYIYFLKRFLVEFLLPQLLLPGLLAVDYDDFEIVVVPPPHLVGILLHPTNVNHHHRLNLNVSGIAGRGGCGVGWS
jgi:hypothetical protein